MLMMATVAFAATAGPAAATCSWVVVRSPNPHPLNRNVLTGVVSVSQRSAWAVGFTLSPKYSPLVAHLTPGGSWARVGTPNPSNGGVLNAVAGVDSDLWAVGNPFPEPQVDHAFVMHWNGSTWRLAGVASLPKGSVLNGVARVSAAGAWAVGGRMAHTGFLVPITLHLVGRTWSVVSAPNPGAGKSADSYFTAAARVPGTALVWAVGTFDDNGGGSGHPFAELRRGASWIRTPLPPVKGHAVMTGVTALSPKNAWAVGTQYPGSPNPATRTLIFHWDGTSWSRVSAPNPGPEGNHLAAVSASSSDNVWVVGDYDPSTGGNRTLVLHWGTAWANVHSPNPAGSHAYLSGVSAVPGSARVWSVGRFLTRNQVDHTLIERGC
jgi:hypothetical protein